MAELIIGGARSGKSAHAERLALQAEAQGYQVIYLATAQAGDGEMVRRVAHHRQRRPAHWLTLEETLHLARALEAQATPATCLLVDCLTLWLTNLFFAGQAGLQAEAGEALACPLLRGEIQALLEVLARLPGRIILVSNEVGWGIVPMERLSRAFADEQGRLNQQVAAVCERVTLVAAGLALRLK
ncbi:MAG: bifunctional adenosylcobinamide kinase/adenosylcobinamide-phosphate guanylyltransferase [Azovibrio sp.]|uniref:bifunctional adenosylcobinamide kinase/adenosylcobinamide-phosphate guanylyltransferase n=1 Tax=Azovibrio sp. TaxID=1872673 RepID=UPI003C739776